MTFTDSLSTDIGKVRLHINDLDSTNVKLTDEAIQYALDEQSTVGGAVIWCIQFLIAKLSDPNFTADWLTVDNASAVKSLRELMADKRQEFGISAVTATTAYAWRPDSNLTEAPTFDSEDE